MPRQYTPRVEVICRNCNQPFFQPPSSVAEGKGKYCSTACRQAARGAVTRTCETCGASFTATPSRIRRDGAKYCCHSCYGIARSTIYVGDKNPRWRGGISTHAAGYLTINLPGRGQVLLHRYLMEQHLGRLLRDDELVHHRDGDKRNNAIDNLQIVDPTEHQHIHMALQGRWSRKHERCVVCGTTERRHEAHGMCINCYQIKRYHWSRRAECPL